MKKEDMMSMQRRMFEMCSNMSMEQCQSMMQNMMKSKPDFGNMKPQDDIEPEATAELKVLFFEWLGQIEEEIADFMEDQNTNDLVAISQHFNLSEESCAYLLKNLESKK